MNVNAMNSKLKRFGEVWHTTGAPPVDFYGVLNSEENDLQYPVGIPLTPGSIIRRSIDGSSWLVQTVTDRRIYRRATLSRCRHLASITRHDTAERDAFGRSTATEPQTVLADVPLLLTDRSMTTDTNKDRSAVVWRLRFSTSASYDIRIGDQVQTATIAATVTDARVVTPGLLELATVA